jgi:non-ribosomal peptide synthetase-like protein
LTATLCAIAAEILGVATVAPDATFFDDLGADSLTMAKFCANVRKRAGLPKVSMKDVYRWPSVAAIVEGVSSTSAPTATSVPVPRVGAEPASAPAFLATIVSVDVADPPAPAEPPAPDFFGILAAYRAILAGLLECPEVSPAAHVFEELGADSMTMAKFCAAIRKRPELPAVSMKDVYRHPNLAELAAALATGTETRTVEPILANSRAVIDDYRLILAEVLDRDDVTVTADFFTDLGADSMAMARFCARVRKRPDLPPVTMKDIYRYPDLKQLAGALAPMGDPAIVEPPVAADPGWVSRVLASEHVLDVPAAPLEPAPVDEPPAVFVVAPVGRITYALCGLTQMLFLLLLPVLLSAASVVGYRWLNPAHGFVDTYLRAVAFAAGGVLACFVVPVLLKWTLVGRWKPTTIRVWSPRYLRFWLVKSVVQRNPLVPMMLGSPLYCVYLRALGARIGRGTTILTNQAPLCTDLFSVGADTIIRRDAVLPGYHAEAGVIRTGRVTLGDRVVVSAKTVVDIETSMGDDAQLGHASALHPGQHVPAGEHWYGSPAEPGSVDFAAVEPDDCRHCSRRRRTVFGISQLLWTIVFSIPLGIAVLDGFWNLAIRLSGGAPGTASMTTAHFYATAAAASATLFFGVLVVWFPVLNLSARALSLLVRPGKVYRLHGMRHSALRTITRITTMKFYAGMVADSSYVVHFLRALGYRLTPIQQTGTNFGTVAHDTPFAARVGTGTVIADGLSINNVDYSASTFRVAPVSIGAHSFLGNGIAYPPGAKVGDNCLIGTMTMVPIDGPIREGVGLLGSPPFEIPRTVARDTGFAIEDPAELRRGLRRKNRHNTVTLLLFLLVRWVGVFSLFVFAEAGGEAIDSTGGAWGLALAEAGYAMFLFLFYLAVERACTRYASLCPDGVSIYDNRFWRHERYWKVPSRGYVQFLNGTPFKSAVLRLLGARIGKRVFDDGASFPEKSFVTVGDYATLNASSGAQTHSQEDGAFKSAKTVIGAGVTLGVASFVHYGVTIGDGAVLAADSFLMKGEQVPAGEYWAGNPAQPADPFTDLDESEPRGQLLRVAPSPRPVPPTRAPRGAGVLLFLYSLALLSGAAFLLAEPGWDLAWRGVGVAAVVVAAGLDATLLKRRRSTKLAASTDRLPIDA